MIQIKLMKAIILKIIVYTLYIKSAEFFNLNKPLTENDKIRMYSFDKIKMYK